MARHRRTSDRARTARAVLAPIGLAAVSAVGASPLALAAPAAPAAPTPTTVGQGDAVPCTDTADVCVDLSEHRAWLADDGVATGDAMTITSGSPEDPTPTGTTTVSRKERHHVSQENRDAPMPYSIFFDDEGRAFHSGDTAGTSHGCIHLEVEDARTVFAALDIGDEVQIRR
jgi:hypothetical protein